MTPIEAKTLKKWLDKNGVKLLAFLDANSYIVVIHNPVTGAYGMAEGCDFGCEPDPAEVLARCLELKR
jgi:hypothetical protein